MTAYVVAHIEVKEPARYEAEYIAYVQPTVARHGGRALAVTEEADVKEAGYPSGRTVIIEFPDKAAAEAWYADADYQPLLKIRKQLSAGSLAIVPGVS